MKLKQALLFGAALLSAIGVTALAQQPGINSTINPVFAIPIDNKAPTYGAAIRGLVAASSATDIYTLCGSSSAIVRPISVHASGRATGAASVDVSLVIRTTANSGGTSTAVTIVKYDNNFAAATAVATAYTANPTIGTQQGGTGAMLSTKQLFLGNLTTGQPGPSADWVFGNRPAGGIVLRGAAQCLAISLNGQSASGNLMELAVEWTEYGN